MTGQVDVKAFWPEWEIEKRIGSGSYGTVYRAKKVTEETTVYSAVKVISIPFADSEVESMVVEGLTVNDSVSYYRQLTEDIVKEVSFMESCKGSTNIVSVEDYKVVERDVAPFTDIYIRMELLTPLNTYLCDKTLSEKEVIKLGIDLCNALCTCEKRNIIHRDIKPENIFVDVFGDYKLGDFGIARSLEGMTFGFSQKGTFNYMAPEVFNSSFYDSRADIYSLGIVLYKLLNHNRLPFLDSEKQLLSPGERRLAVERRLKGDKLPGIKGVSEKLSDIIIKACEYRPENRFKTAEEMKEALTNLQETVQEKDLNLNGKQESAADESCEDNLKKTKLTRALIVVCVALAAAIVVFGVLFVKEYTAASKRYMEKTQTEVQESIPEQNSATEDSVTEDSETDNTDFYDEIRQGEYAKAISMYMEKDFDGAYSIFSSLKDYKNAEYYRERIEESRIQKSLQDEQDEKAKAEAVAQTDTKSKSEKVAEASQFESEGKFEEARAIYSELGLPYKGIYAETYLKEADILLENGKKAEAGKVLLNIINQDLFDNLGCHENIIDGSVGDDYFELGGIRYTKARQYIINGGGVLFALYYSDFDYAPECFHYRYEKGDYVNFYDYDMAGNFLSDWYG